MSAMPSSGLVGVSHQITRVERPHRARTASRSDKCTGVCSTPHRAAPGRSPERPAVRVVGQQHVIAGPQTAAAGCRRRPARSRRQPPIAPSSAASALPGRSASGWRCGCTRSRPAGRHAVLLVRGRRVDRDAHRAGERVGSWPGVMARVLKPARCGGAGHARHDSCRPDCRHSEQPAPLRGCRTCVGMGSPHSRRWRWTAIAASVLAVLAVVSIVLVTTRNSGKNHPTPRPTPSTSALAHLRETRPVRHPRPVGRPQEADPAPSATVNAPCASSHQLPAGVCRSPP